ncbi:MAG: hypothetical protein KC912_23855 [Proteobacteria bacterium]|nr:hypothetical protein [Pseudomonadota bacterium]
MSSPADVRRIGHCEVISGDLTVRGGPSLTDLDGLLALSSIGGSLSILDSEALVHIDGLSNVRSIGQGYYVDRLGARGHSTVSIRDNGSLWDLDGLSGVVELRAALEVSDNNALRDIDGLSGLIEVGGEPDSAGFGLNIGGNASLPHLDGLAGVQRVNGPMRVSSNDALESIAGLSALTTVAGHVSMGGNPMLCDSYVEALLARITYEDDGMIWGNNDDC